VLRLLAVPLSSRETMFFTVPTNDSIRIEITAPLLRTSRTSRRPFAAETMGRPGQFCRSTTAG
jgi:hypothetical protein